MTLASSSPDDARARARTITRERPWALDGFIAKRLVQLLEARGSLAAMAVVDGRGYRTKEDQARRSEPKESL